MQDQLLEFARVMGAKITVFRNQEAAEEQKQVCVCTRCRHSACRALRNSFVSVLYNIIAYFLCDCSEIFTQAHSLSLQKELLEIEDQTEKSSGKCNATSAIKEGVPLTFTKEERAGERQGVSNYIEEGVLGGHAGGLLSRRLEALNFRAGPYSASFESIARPLSIEVPSS